MKKKVNWSSYIPYLLVLICVGVIGLYFYKDTVQSAANGLGGVYFSRDINPESGLVVNNHEILQEFTTTRDHIGRIGIGLKRTGNVDHTRVQVILREKGETKSLQEWEFDANDISQNTTFHFFALNDILVGKEKEMELQISCIAGEDEGQIQVYTSNNYDTYGKLYLDGKKEAGTIALAIGGPVQYISKLFWALIAAFAIVLLMLVYISQRKKLPLEKVFLLVAGFLGMVYLFLFPPYSEPDSRAHIATAYYYADCLTGREPSNEEGRTMVRLEDFEADGLSEFLGMDNLNTVKENLFTKAENTEMVAYNRGKMSVPPSAFVPQILGTSLGLVSGCGGTMTLYLGKIFTFIFYLLCCYYAIKLIPFGKMLLFFCAILPFSLETATSYSYDSTVLALSFLMIGYACYLKCEKERVTTRDIIIWSILTVWLAPCKIVYYFLGFLIFLVPAGKFKTKKHYYLAGISAAGLGMVALALGRMTTITSAVGGQPGRYFTIEMFFADIPKSILMIGRTINCHFEDYMKQIFGSLYSWMDLHLSWMFVMAYLLLFLMVLLKRQDEKMFLDGRDKGIMGLICLMVSAMIAASMLFTWTPPESNMIEGIQGRYFLPILPLIAFIFRNRIITIQKNVDYQLVLAIMSVQYLTVLQIFTAIIRR